MKKSYIPNWICNTCNNEICYFCIDKIYYSNCNFNCAYLSYYNKIISNNTIVFNDNYYVPNEDFLHIYSYRLNKLIHFLLNILYHFLLGYYIVIFIQNLDSIYLYHL